MVEYFGEQLNAMPSRRFRLGTELLARAWSRRAIIFGDISGQRR